MIYGVLRNGVLLNLDGMGEMDDEVLDPPVYATRELAEQALADARMLARARRESVVVPLRVVGEGNGVISVEQIAAATKANDDDTDAGRDFNDVLVSLDIEREALESVATNRALKALSVLFHGRPDAYTSVEQVVRDGGAEQITILSTLAGCFIDGFAARSRIEANGDTVGALELADRLAVLASERVDDATQTLGDLADEYLAARGEQ